MKKHQGCARVKEVFAERNALSAPLLAIDILQEQSLCYNEVGAFSLTRFDGG